MLLFSLAKKKVDVLETYIFLQGSDHILKDLSVILRKIRLQFWVLDFPIRLQIMPLRHATDSRLVL